MRVHRSPSIDPPIDPSVDAPRTFPRDLVAAVGARDPIAARRAACVSKVWHDALLERMPYPLPSWASRIEGARFFSARAPASPGEGWCLYEVAGAAARGELTCVSRVLRREPLDGPALPAHADDGALLVEAVAERDGISAVALSPRGDELALGTELGRTERRSLEGDCISAIDGLRGPVRAAEHREDGLAFAACFGRYAELALESFVDGGLKVPTLYGHQGDVTGVAFAGRLVLTGGLDQRGLLWRLGSTGTLELKATPKPAPVRTVALAPEGRFALMGGDDEAAHLFASSTGAPLSTHPGFTGGVRAVAFAPDTQLFAAGGAQGTLHLLDARAPKAVVRLEQGPATVAAIVLGAEGRLVLSASGDRAHLYDTRAGGRLVSLLGHTDAVTDADLDRAGHRAVTASLDGTVRIWSLDQLHAGAK